MSKKLNSFSVNVAPEMFTYLFFRSLPYGEETALAEFVDNAIQSFKDKYEAISQNNNSRTKLEVTISINSEKKEIIIEDNAAGINRSNMQKAVRLGLRHGESHRPESLSVYGIGMKAAAIWFSSKWELNTSAIGSKEKLSLSFDLEYLLKNNKTSLVVHPGKESPTKHHTKIIIKNCERNLTQGYYEETVLPFLLETFHKFNDVEIKMIYDGQPIEIEDKKRKKLYLTKPVPLEYNNNTWEKKISLPFEDGRVYGFIMVLKRGGYKQPGIRLLRNNRIIEGTTVHRNLPEIITGTINKYGAQRIYGELNLNHCAINYQKTAFDLDLNPLYEKLKEELKDLLRTADTYRARENKNDKSNSDKKVKEGGKDKSSSDKEVPQNKKRTSPNEIKLSPLVKEKLGAIDNDKFLKLYESLCSISLKKHAILAYVGTWSFFESLANEMGKNDGTSFVSYFIPKIDSWWREKKEKGKKKDIKDVLKDIHSKGNGCKHSGIFQLDDAKQLKIDFRVLEHFIIRCIEELP